MHRINHMKLKPAFTMLEVIFVIVILGIVASIGSQIIVKVYDSYITQRALHRSSTKTELAATQLANRLAYSITGTVIGRKADNTFLAVEDISTTDYVTLEWIAYDADSFGAITAGGTLPVWSGYADVNASTSTALSTPGSKLTNLGSIISNLSNTNSGITNSAILFPSTYNSRTVGFDGSGANDIHTVSGNAGDTTLNVSSLTGKTIKEHYKLAWTAYAVAPVVLSSAEKIARGFQGTDAIWDLELWYDYQPWQGEAYTADNKKQILIRNISVFKFTGSGNTIRIKLCQRESIGEAFTITTCKEKAVIR